MYEKKRNRKKVTEKNQKLKIEGERDKDRVREKDRARTDVGARARSVPVKESKTHSYKICKHCQKLFMSDAPQNA